MKSSLRVYFILLWNEQTKSIDFQQSSLELGVIVETSVHQLSRMHVPEDGYKTFLIDRLRSWKGSATQVTTLSDYKLLLLVDDLLMAAAPRPIPAMDELDFD